MSNLNLRNTLGWVDLLKIIACFLVVLSHCSDPFTAQFNNSRVDFLSGAYWGSLVRCSVPLFVMMTGVLLLPIKEDMSTFYKKRISRVLGSLVFWAIVTPILYYVYFMFVTETGNPNISLDNYTIEATLTKLYTFIFNFNYDIIPFWYLYMLIGLYLFIPIINPWLIQSTKRELKMYLYFWVFTMFLPLIKLISPLLGYHGNYGNSNLLGESVWNTFGMFYYFSGFMGYMVLTYYLKKYPIKWSLKKTTVIAIILFVVGYTITVLGFLKIQNHYPGNYEYLEIPWYFFGINVFLMVFAVYILIQKIVIKSSILHKISSLMFGVFLCHFFIVQVVYDMLNPILNIPPFFKIPIYAIVTFSISTVVVYLLKRIKITRKFVS